VLAFVDTVVTKLEMLATAVIPTAALEVFSKKSFLVT
jgi:hypothetical protein